MKVVPRVLAVVVRAAAVAVVASVTMLTACDIPVAVRQQVPPPRGDTGRVILSIPTLPDEVWDVNRVLARRLWILHASASIKYDLRRAVIDVSGLPPAALPHVAQVLADPGFVALRDGRGRVLRAPRGEIAWISGPSAGCDCAARLRLELPAEEEAWLSRATPPLALEHNGVDTGLRITRWGGRITFHDDDPNANVDVGYNILIDTVLAPDQMELLLLVLGGGALPPGSTLASNTSANTDGVDE